MTKYLDYILIAVIWLATLMHLPDLMAMEQQTIHLGDGAPWYVMIVITLVPGAAAIVLTLGTVWVLYVLRKRRAKVDTLISMALIAGMLWGPLMQWGLQELVSDFTGAAINYKLIVIAPFITGLASIIVYWFALMPYLNKKHKKLADSLRIERRTKPRNDEQDDNITERKR